MDAYEILRYAALGGGPSVLATVIGVEGHSYRKAGAAMLFLERGGELGSISPGCLEADLRERVRPILDSGRPELISYNLEPDEDAMWGEAIGCGGKLLILMEAVRGELAAALADACRANDSGVAVVLSRWKRAGRIEYRMRRTDEGGSAALSGADSGLAAEAGERIFEQRFEPRTRLVLFGAGDDVDPVFRIAGRVGFRVAVADWRKRLLTRERFPSAELAAGNAEAIVRELGVGSRDFVLLCGHQLQRDREMLEAVLPLAPAYLGVMGSRKRIRLLFDGLDMPPFVRAPVGLDIGGDGPEEIAVSIAAELIAVRRSCAADWASGGSANEGDSRLFGGGNEPADGRTEAVPRACAR
ncbi:XdhC family protein [Cohnella fermenti]|uniref:XdhC family protein n=1 Tax=Cohnella fermenti TaxID=2565925 RepID=A0A4S4C2N8_9BACL|nr:XdhC/CoxI family protein [Cohnella fermenti]THF81309.1 XdhC family protein [Cohnella fermenti]